MWSRCGQNDGWNDDQGGCSRDIGATWCPAFLVQVSGPVVGQSDWNHAGVIAELTPNLLRYIYEVLRTGHDSGICHAEPGVIEGDTLWNLFLTKMHLCACWLLQCVLVRQ